VVSCRNPEPAAGDETLEGIVRFPSLGGAMELVVLLFPFATTFRRVFPGDLDGRPREETDGGGSLPNMEMDHRRHDVVSR
jgi:hypothetical protein